jgi:hypothetical protein
MSENDRTQTQSQAQKARGGENGSQNLPTHSHRAKGVDGKSRDAQHFFERATGADRAGSDPFGLVSQQVVKRLIWQASDRLQEAKDCVDWYEKQVSKLSKEIEELEQLEQLVRDQSATEGEE